MKRVQISVGNRRSVKVRHALGFAMCAFFLFSGCDETCDVIVRQPAEGGTLVFATTRTNPPYSYFDDEKQEFMGIDVEISRATAKKMGLPLKIVACGFSELLPFVKSGRADFAANTITITPARQRDVAFSTPYASDGSAFLYRVGSVMPTIPKAGNMRVGCMMSSTCHFYLCYHGINPYCYENFEEVFTEFKKGNIDAVFYDAGVIRKTARGSNGVFAVTPLETRENYGVAVRKDFPALLEAVNQVVAERRAK